MNKLKSIWQIEDLRKKILFTLLLILVFRLGCSIPVPFVSNTALDSMFSNDSIFGYMNMLSGGALSRCAFFALGVSPYINSSIITQLLCVALPSWEALQKETTGKDKLDEYTKRIALAMAAIMSIGYYFVLRNYGALEYTAGKSGFFAAVVIMATFLAGSQLSVWIGGRIDEFGIGNGVSILIFAGIVSRWTDINTIAHNIAVQVESGNWLYSLVGIGMVVAMLFAVWFVSYSDGAERRIPVQYAARKSLDEWCDADYLCWRYYEYPGNGRYVRRRHEARKTSFGPFCILFRQLDLLCRIRYPDCSFQFLLYRDSV